MVLTISFALSPVIGLSCHRHPADMASSAPGRADVPPLDLTPASRRQDHTTSPSASASFVCAPLMAHGKTRPAITHRARRCPRPSHPVPNVRDDRETPLVRDGMAGVMDLIWGKREGIYFLRWGWTGGISLIRFNKSPGARKSVTWHAGAIRDDIVGRNDIAATMQRSEIRAGVPSRSRSRIAHRSPQRRRQRGTPWTEKRIGPMRCEAHVGSRG
jgi:hypothetical protein